jgi:tripeptide aminopeptidase
MELNALTRDAACRRACRWLHEHDEQTLSEQIALTRVAAPPFAESARAAEVLRRFREIGLARAGLDEVGNVVARLPGTDAGDAGAVLLIAHLDTVFPAETRIEVRQGEDGRIFAPGITDNGRGLAAMLAIARAVSAAGLRTRRPLVFVGSVGEEGRGDLRGVKHLFREGSPWRDAHAAIALDGTGATRIVTTGIGSRRLRVVYRGAGGHSWSDWGVANPAMALGRAIAALDGLPPPGSPKTTLTVARLGGGTSVNSIPEEAWMEIDLRSESGSHLERLEREARRAIRGAADAAREAAARPDSTMEIEVEVIGDRPAGSTPMDAPLVAAAAAATRFVGGDPDLIGSSTDANVPMSLGIPAIALGCGGDGGGIHTLGEWYANEEGPSGIERCLWTALAASQP